MSLTDNPPSLALSDIMYHMSPSPAPPDEHSRLALITNDLGSGESSKAEEYSQLDVAGIRLRLNELGFSVIRNRNTLEGIADSDTIISSREKEILDMVIILLEAASVDPAQLERQAETIANLTIQRDYMAQQMEEERERWQSERESWDRTAEALLSLRNKPSKSEDVERVRAAHESENRSLRDKLQDSHKRISALESELLRLKPMLLMQPFTSSRHDKGKGREHIHREHLVVIPEDSVTNDTHEKAQYYHNYQSHSHSKNSTPSAMASTSKDVSTAQPIPPAPRCRSRDLTSSSKSQGKRNNHSLTSDAYTEHLLLAAKKIGRKRAAVVAGIMRHAEREKEALAQEQEQIRSQKEQERMEQERQERIANGTYGAYYRTGPEASTSSPQRGAASKSASVPRTPKRNALHYSNMGPGPSSHVSTGVMESPLVYMNVNSAASSYGSPWAGSGVMGTPGQIKSALNRQNGRAANSEKVMATSNPPTPLASLLDAALMMNEDGRGGSKQRGKTNGKGRALEEPDSPVPKRRKTSSAGKHVFGGSGGGLDRVKSALDVLADQADQAAAAFTDIDHTDNRTPAATDSAVTLKGKGKGKEKSFPQQDIRDEPQDSEDSGLFAQESNFVSARTRGRPRRDSAVTTRSRPESTVTQTVTSSRPVRQASRKRALSSEQHPESSTSGTARGPTRGRGRPRGSTSRPRHGKSDSNCGGTSHMLSAPGLRVIAHASGYSPLDEALMASDISPNGKNASRDRSTEHSLKPQPTQATEQTSLSEPKIGGLRPVVGWGDRNIPSLDSDPSPLRGPSHVSSKSKDPSPVIQSSVPLEYLSATHNPMPISQPIIDIRKCQDTLFNDTSPAPLNGHGHGQDQTPSLSPPNALSLGIESSVVNDLEAGAEADEDKDAEGEQEEGEDEDADADAEGDGISTKHHSRSRSRSPPPPDPPPPGPGNGSPPNQNDEHDPDADAEGEMEFEDNEGIPSGGYALTSSSARKAATGDLLDLIPCLSSDRFFLLTLTLSIPETPRPCRSPMLSPPVDHVLLSSLLASLSDQEIAIPT